MIESTFSHLSKKIKDLEAPTQIILKATFCNGVYYRRMTHSFFVRVSPDGSVEVFLDVVIIVPEETLMYSEGSYKTKILVNPENTVSSLIKEIPEGHVLNPEIPVDWKRTGGFYVY